MSTVDSTSEAEIEGLYESVKGLNAVKLFSYFCERLQKIHNDQNGNGSSFQHYRRVGVLTKLSDQVFYRTKRRELDFCFDVQDYRTQLPGACKLGLKAVLEAIELGVEMPENTRSLIGPYRARHDF